MHAPGELEWIPVPQIERELATLAYTDASSENPINIVEAVRMATEHEVALVTNRAVFELCTQYPETAERVWYSLSEGRRIPSMMTGTIVFAAGRVEREGKKLGRKTTTVESITTITSPSGEIKYEVPPELKLNVGFVDHPDYSFDTSPGKADLVLHDAHNIPLFERKGRLEHLEANTEQKFADAVYNSYPVLAVNPSVFPQLDESILGALTVYYTPTLRREDGSVLEPPFGQRFTQFIKTEARLIVASRPLRR